MSQTRFEQLKAALIAKDIVEINKLPSAMPDLEALALAVIPLKKEIAQKKDYLTRAVTEIEQDSTRSDDSKYIALLLESQKVFLEIEQLVDQHITHAPKMNTDAFKLSSLHTDIKEVLNHNTRMTGQLASTINTPVTQHDILFANLYFMCKQALGDEAVKPIVENVVNGTTTQAASKELVDLAYDALLQPKLAKDKKEALMKIIVAYETKATNAHDLFNKFNGVKMQDLTISLEERCHYKALARNNAQFTSYRDSLKSLSDQTSTENRAHHSTQMKTALDMLVKDANKLYLDSKVKAEIKDECAELMNALGQFVGDVAKIRSVQNFQPSPINPQAQKPNHDVAALTSSVQQQAGKIEQKISALSKNTATKNWGRILFVAIVTLGIGIIGINKSLKSGSTFFKREIPVVKDARKLVKQGDLDIKMPATQATSAGSPGSSQPFEQKQVSLEF